MRKKTYLIITMFFLINSLVMPVVGSQNYQTISSYGTISYSSDMKWLHTEGRLIMDSDGNIILRGANFPGYGQGDWESHTLEDYEKMKSWGFNVVRLPIHWNYIEPEPGLYDENYLSIIDRDIAWAKQLGMYIVLDMHQWQWSPYFTFAGKGAGMPIWLVNSYENSANGMSQAIADFWFGKAPNNTEATPENPSMQDRFIAMWKKVVTRYANEPTICAYDLFNEPLNGENSTALLTPLQTSEYLYPFYVKLISEIRNIDANHIIIYEPVGGYSVRTAQLLNYSNIVFSFHFYQLSTIYSGNITELEEDFLTSYWNQPWQNPIKGWDIPIWIGEFGSGIESWVRDTVYIFNKYEIGWSWWAYNKSDRDPMALFYTDGIERVYLTMYLKQK